MEYAPTSFSHRLVDFARYARSKGLSVGMMQTFDTVRLAKEGLLQDKRLLKHALRSVCCTDLRDLDLFNEVFEAYWSGNCKAEYKPYVSKKEQKDTSKSSIIFMGKKKGEDDDGDVLDAKNTSSSNRAERVRKTDFTKISEIDTAFFEDLSKKLCEQMYRRMLRKTKRANRAKYIDMASTIRKSISEGGNMLDIQYKERKIKKRRLVILLDVSGSMDKYSFYLLRFIYTLKDYFEKIEVFIFSTSLLRITDILEKGDLKLSLALVSRYASNWSSGTRIGECLGAFNKEYAKRVLARSAISIVLSDGLDTGDTDMLSKEMEKIQKRSKQLIWLNPLKGMRSYQPIQRGMKSALPHIDTFSSAHNLDSLLELERYLQLV